MIGQIVMPELLRNHMRTQLLGQKLCGMKTQKVLGVGNTAVTYEAIDEFGIPWALKLVTRESYGDRAPFREIGRFASAQDERFLVFPKAVGEWSLRIKGQDHDFIWFKSRCVKGQTLKGFHDSGIKYNAKAEITRFIEDISTGLEELKMLGFMHGDLHDRNIMRESIGASGRLPETRYVIIDFSEACPIESPNEGLAPDMDNFGEHLRRFYDKVHSRTTITREDERVLDAITHIPGLVTGGITESANIGSSSSIMDRFLDGLRATEEAPRKLSDPFHPLNSENIANDALLADLCFTKMAWVPDLLENDNVLLIGPRGCGKTMIFRRLRLKTKIAAQKNKEIRKEIQSDRYVGFYLPCESLFYMRFADLSEVDISVNREALVLFFNMAIMTEVCSTLQMIPRKEEVPSTLVASMTALLRDEVGQLWDQNRLPSLLAGFGDIAECAESIMRSIRNSIAYRERVACTGATDFASRLVKILKSQVPIFAKKYFVFFLDDFTEERVPLGLQRELHRIVSQRSSDLCFKISAHMFGSIYNQPQPLALDEGRNINVINLGSAYLRLNRRKREGKLLIEILNTRFKHCEGYGKSIEKWLGRTSYPGGRTLARALHDKETRRKVHYHGVDCIRDLCTGDYSEMIRMVGEIFREANIRPGMPVRLIPAHVQDRAIDRVSREFLGRIRHIRPDGQKLFEIIDSFGKLSQQILYDRKLVGQGKDSKGLIRKDPYDLLSIYVDDLTKASQSARMSWERLQKASILVDIGLAPSQRMVISDRATLRRIFCPAFRTTLTSSEHLQLKKEHFEWLMDKPSEYALYYLRQNVGQAEQETLWSDGTGHPERQEEAPPIQIPDERDRSDFSAPASIELAELVNDLPPLREIEDIVRGGSHYDLYIGAIGFEDRTTSAIESLLSLDVTANGAVLFEYDLYYDANEKRREIYEGKITTLTRGKTYRPFNAAVGNPDSIFAERLRSLLTAISRNKLTRILFDCTSCTSLILSKALSVLFATPCELTILYSEAKEYFPTKREWESGSLRKEGRRVEGPFAGVRFVAKPPELQSDDVGEHPVLLVLFPTVNTERTDGVLAELDPDKRIWLFGEPHDLDSNGYRIEMAKAFAAPIMHPRDDWSTITTFDYRQTVLALSNIYKEHRLRYRIVIMPHGSKMQTLGTSIFARVHQASMVFAMPKTYDPGRYSSGSLKTWAIALGETEELTARLRKGRAIGNGMNAK